MPKCSGRSLKGEDKRPSLSNRAVCRLKPAGHHGEHHEASNQVRVLDVSPTPPSKTNGRTSIKIPPSVQILGWASVSWGNQEHRRIRRGVPTSPKIHRVFRISHSHGPHGGCTLRGEKAGSQPCQARIVHPCLQCPDPQRRLGRPGTHVETQRFKKVQCMDPMSCAGKQTTKSSGYSITHASSTHGKKGLEGTCTPCGGHHQKSGVLLTMQLLHASSENVIDSASQEDATIWACASVRNKDGKAPCRPNRAHHPGAHVELVVSTKTMRTSHQGTWSDIFAAEHSSNQKWRGQTCSHG